MKTRRQVSLFAMSLFTALQTLPVSAAPTAGQRTGAPVSAAAQPAAPAQPSDVKRDGQQPDPKTQKPEVTNSADLGTPPHPVGAKEDLIPVESQTMLKKVMTFAAIHYPSVLASKYQVKAQQAGIVTSILSNITANYNYQLSSQHDDYNISGTGGNGIYTCPKKGPALWGCGAQLPDDQNGLSRSYQIQASVSLSTIFQITAASLSYQESLAASEAVQTATALAAGTAYVKYSIARFQWALLAKAKIMLAQVHLNKSQLTTLEQATVDSKEKDFDEKGAQVYVQAKQALNDLTMYVDPKDIAKIEAQVNKTSNAQADAVFTEGRNGVNTDQLKTFFPTQAHLEDAYALAQKAPALVQAKLAEDSSLNSFFLVLSSVGPKFAAAVAHTRSDAWTTIYTKTPTEKAIEDDAVTLGVSFQLNLGTPSQAMGSNYQHKAATFTTEVSKRTVVDSLSNLYATMGLQTDLINENSASLLKDLNAFPAEGVTSSNVASVVSLESTIINDSNTLTSALQTAITTRLQIHAATGELLKFINVDPKRDVTDKDIQESAAGNADRILPQQKPKLTQINAN